jgi:hypothetical protein
LKPKLSEKKGPPAFTICDLAHEIETDLIVISCRGNALTDEGATNSIIVISKRDGKLFLLKREL